MIRDRPLIRPFIFEQFALALQQARSDLRTIVSEHQAQIEALHGEIAELREIVSSVVVALRERADENVGELRRQLALIRLAERDPSRPLH